MWWKAGWSIAAALAFLLGAYMLLILNFFHFSCANTLIKSATSPDGRFKAVLFERNCGVTTSVVAELSIIRANRELSNDRVDVRFADTLRKNEYLGWDGQRTVLHWRDKSTLEVRCDLAAHGFHRPARWRGIVVLYEKNCVKAQSG